MQAQQAHQQYYDEGEQDEMQLQRMALQRLGFEVDVDK